MCATGQHSSSITVMLTHILLPTSLGMICTNDTILVGPVAASAMQGSVNTVKTEAGVGVRPRDLQLLLE